MYFGAHVVQNKWPICNNNKKSATSKAAAFQSLIVFHTLDMFTYGLSKDDDEDDVKEAVMLINVTS